MLLTLLAIWVVSVLVLMAVGWALFSISTWSERRQLSSRLAGHPLSKPKRL